MLKIQIMASPIITHDGKRGHGIFREIRLFGILLYRRQTGVWISPFAQEYIMKCVICNEQESLECDNLCPDCFAEMADDMMYEYYKEFDPPTKGKCYVCGISTIFTTCCVACLDSGNIPF